MAEQQAPEIQINVKGPSELKLQISITTDKTVLDLKQAIASKSDVEADRQRLIYSGRVLKDDDLLSVYKIQSGHTIHMVKGVNRSAASTSAAAPAAALPTMQTGQNVHDPLTQLNSHLGFGAMAGINPFADMGLNPNDPNMMQNMMNSPEFLQQMAAMMRNPAVIDQMIAMDPRLASMGPQVRQAFQDENFQRMISNPESFRQMMQMAQMFRGAGLGGGPAGGGLFGAPPPAFPAPGDPNAPSGANSASSPTTPPTSANQPPPFNPFSLFGGLGGMTPPANPGSTPTTGTGSSPTPGATGGTAPANPFGFDPASMPPFGAWPGMWPTLAPPAAPADTRPPEERFQTQLQQLQEMGLTNAQQNVRALLATGGNVQAAIEYIFSGGGL